MSESNQSEHGRQPTFPIRLGIIGGGQLARMTAMAALPLGVEVVVLEKTADSPASPLAAEYFEGDWTDRDLLMRFAQGCEVVTLENEFVDAAALEALERANHRVFPSAACMALTQDKFQQKSCLQGAGLPAPRFGAVRSAQEIIAAGKRLGWPMILKKRRNGYDGKGNYTLNSEQDASAGWDALQGDQNALMVEAFFPFTKELAVIVTCGLDGTTAVYPVVETIQHNHVCHVVKAPVEVWPQISEQAATLARRAVEAVGGVGSFGVEMFLSAKGELAINELAPRVHNSGHYTIEACHCSQFENHVRAVLGWPLGDPAMTGPAAVMVNLLGKHKASGQPRGVEAALRIPGARVHLYGKTATGPGRKMGHVTVLGNSVEEAESLAQRAAREIYFGDTL